jgi:hypothetical protein
MKLRYLALALLLGTLTVLPACSVAFYPGGPTLRGIIYADIDSPVQDLAIHIDPAAKPIKRGTARTRSFFGLFAWGDGSIEAAMKDGEITRIHHVDHNIRQILSGLWMADTTIVYGE